MTGVPARVVLEVVGRNILGTSTNPLPGCFLFPHHSLNDFLACLAGFALIVISGTMAAAQLREDGVSGALAAASPLPPVLLQALRGFCSGLASLMGED